MSESLPVFEVFPYDQSLLIDILSRISGINKDQISKKQHVGYLNGYLEHQQAKTLVIEYDYIDKDYLEDYAAYYVRSFFDYSRKCCRIHFFSLAFESANFKELLIGTHGTLNSSSAQNSYLGFVVIKPLPQTIIGRTCLKTYEVEGHRHFPTIRNYSVNLFGVELNIESIAYQEQDSIVAACASSAIWSAFQTTGLLFQHTIPSPVEITKAATVHFPYANRHFPNKGLTPEQMAHAIRNVGLEPFLINGKYEVNLKSNVYAYLKGKIPLILGMSLNDVDKKGKIIKTIGKHAVTITGYNFNESLPMVVIGENGFRLKAAKIQSFYVHDDRVGCFAKMEFDGVKVEDKLSLSSGIPSKALRATPDLLVIPLYHKIRIPFNTILNITHLLDSYVKKMAKENKAPLPEFEWNIFLSDVTDFKKNISKTTPLPAEYKYEILTSKLPKYIWRAICETNNSPRIEFIFDATDIDQGRIFMKHIVYDRSISIVFETFALTDMNLIPESQIRYIMEGFRKEA